MSNEAIRWRRDERWQVICGDDPFWRAGIYSPAEASIADVVEVETHDCPELFLLIEGRMTLVLVERDGVREVPLEPGIPMMVTTAHGAYCPDGPHSGIAFVVERASLTTQHAPITER